MGVRINKKIALLNKAVMYCPTCKCEYHNEVKFCTKCGNKLQKRNTKVYANVSAKGITSFSLQTPLGTINSKGKASIPLGGGISYTTQTRKKRK